MYYWQATLKDGAIIQETSNVEQSREKWKQIQPSIQSLCLIGDDIKIELPSGHPCYHQGKGASMGLGGNDFRIESHWISCRMPFDENGGFLRMRVFNDSKRVIAEFTDL